MSCARKPSAVWAPQIASGPMRVSILDLGSTSFRLLVADVASEGAIRPVLTAREFLGLGSEVASDGSLAEDVIERAVGAAGHLAGLAYRTGAEAASGRSSRYI